MFTSMGRLAAAFIFLASADSAAAAALFRAPSLQDVAGGSAISLGSATAIPRGYYELCKRGHAICRQSAARGLETTGSGAVKITEAAFQQMVKINTSVNRSMRARSDASTGRRDQWTVGGRSGDCEDFALTKKRQLQRAGWPSSATLVALATTRSGQEHAVLVVRTDRGDLVLDNLNDKVRAWNRTGLRFTSIQSPDSTWTWHRL